MIEGATATSGTAGSTRRRASRLPEVVLRLALVVGSLVLAYGTLELGLRLFGDTGYRSTGVIGASPWGEEPDFRDRASSALDLRKPEGTFRVLVVGDSVTWGSGVHAEDAYPARLVRRLRGLNAERRIDVVNWSKTGWNTNRQWRSLVDRLDLIEPDLLILGYSINDAEPDRIDLDRRTDLGRRRPRSVPGSWLLDHSHLFHLVHARLENTRQRRAADAYYFGLYDEAAPGRQRQLEALDEWTSEMRRRDVPMALVIFPMFETQLDSDYPYTELHTRTAELGEEMGLDVLDLLPRYSGVDARRLAVEPFTDSHPHELAHRIAADVLFDWLLEERLLPAG